MPSKKNPPHQRPSLVTGTIRMNPRGFGFVVPDDGVTYPDDIFIPRPYTQNAADGDRVEVQLSDRAPSPKGPEGKVVAIVERARSHLAGVVVRVGRHGCLAYVPLLGKDRLVRIQETQDVALQTGDRVVMDVVDWGSEAHETVCRFSRAIGPIDDPSLDVPAALEEYELRGAFPTAVVRELAKIPERIPLDEIKAREDFRTWDCVTIDPDTAQDYDDAISLKKDGKGRYHLGVHIADVSYYVRPGTALDRESQERCNSTYFPGTCVPMLPEKLSNNLCSLKPNVNRLTVSVLITCDKAGHVISYRICRGVIRSKKRFTYTEAKEILDGEKKSPHAKTLQLMVELCGHLKRLRHERGSLELAIPDSIVVVNKKGEPAGVERVEYDITHQMVEEFMLKANEIVAQHLSEKKRPVSFRIHEEPAAEDIKAFSEVAAAFGFRIPEQPTPEELQKFFDEAVTTPYGEFLAISYIRRMRLAYYSPNNIGHYGLGLEHYCHFTSPIRRYVDLVAHRAIFGEVESAETLQRISDQCSEQERISAKAESDVVLLKKLRYLQRRHEGDPYERYDAVITDVKPNGVAFEVVGLMLDGFLHVATLGDDYYVYDEKKHELKGRHTQEFFRATDSIAVMIREVDLIGRECRWMLVPERRPRHRHLGKGPRRK